MPRRGRGRRGTRLLGRAGPRLQASINGQLLFDVSDDDRPLDSGGVALLCTEGTVVVTMAAVAGA